MADDALTLRRSGTEGNPDILAVIAGFFQQQTEVAVALFRAVLAVNPANAAARGWLAHLAPT